MRRPKTGVEGRQAIRLERTSPGPSKRRRRHTGRTRGGIAWVGQSLRFVVGTDESVFAEAPTERARYTALGMIIITTSIVSAISMGVALHFAVDRMSWFVTALLATIWGLFVLSLDRWLVSASVPAEPWRRVLVFLPRLVLSVVLGLIIAEPILLVVFQSPIAAQVTNRQAADVANLQNKLRTCNPTPDESGSKPTTGSCTDSYLPLPLPTADADALARYNAVSTQIEELGVVVDNDTKAYQQR